MLKPEIEAAAPKLDVKIASADVRKPEEIEPAFKKFEAEHRRGSRRATVQSLNLNLLTQPLSFSSGLSRSRDVPRSVALSSSIAPTRSSVMPLKVCLSTANTLMYPQGGHLWVFINWALGLRACGCEVTWLDVVPPSLPLEELSARYEHLQGVLHPFTLDANLVVDFLSTEDLGARLDEAALPRLESLGPFDLLVDLRYDLPERLFAAFRRKVLINIDPGQYELALAGGAYPYPKHDLLFSIGETTHGAVASKNWLYTPPCVFLDEWPFTLGSTDAPWTTVAHWWGQDYGDSKREGFRPFMTIPSKVRARFELALNIEHKEEQELIESYGFKVHDAHKWPAPGLDDTRLS